MLNLSFFLLIIIIAIYKKKPQKNKQIWFIVFRYLIAALMITFLLILGSALEESTTSYNSLSYIIGTKMSANIFAFLISIPILYFSLKRKMEGKMKYKHPLLLIGLFLMTLVLGLYIEDQKNIQEAEIRELLDKHKSNEESKIDEQSENPINIVEQTVDLFKESLPIKMDDNLVLEKVFFKKDENYVVYVVKDNTKSFDEYSVEEIEYLEVEYKKIFLEISKGNPNNKYFVNANTAIKYYFVDTNDKLIFFVTLLPEEYK
ncbi:MULTISPECIES: hypothetical protein [Empedobacter]|uniref:hypothetical protein n=1 Tax=Empedobacter TaxID=59734 RepID=UPI001C5A3EE5|nr:MULTISPECIES: hypothetical protein [Empedobacter]MBW1619888.1 hypothetical protein [Empedobacter falsenii]